MIDGMGKTSVMSDDDMSWCSGSFIDIVSIHGRVVIGVQDGC